MGRLHAHLVRMTRIAITFVAFGAACSSPDATTMQTPACLDHAANEYRVEVGGEGFDAVAATVHVVTEVRLISADAVTCRASTTAALSGGAFAVDLANRTDEAAYPFIGAFIDSDHDGACTATDLTWGITGETVDPAFTASVTPASFSTGDPDQVCAHFASAP